MSDSRSPVSTSLSHHEETGGPAPPAPLPQAIGRYRVLGLLGQGAFGVVYHAYDDDLRRELAIKVPHARRIAKPEDVKAYLDEARAVASLDHPHIVEVHDVGHSADGLCYVVSKYIEGATLAVRIQEARKANASRPSFAAAEGLPATVELVATLADALHHAHTRGLVHRDVKPGNVLLDKKGKVYLTDFGLALRDEDFGKGAQFAGTPAYMSPEQARGEGHRVDGRSDVFSLGVVLYELLTGERPFRGTWAEVLEWVLTAEAKPPRQVNDAIPRELERVCLKALSKRASDRYTTAKDLADDLRSALTGPVAAAPLVPPLPAPVAVPAAAPGSATPSDQRLVCVVPKGLRSFDGDDANFFLDLLPGPRDRHGLPESVRFWKAAVEGRDGERPFAVGLLYGPSGCGKSSLVKAGLLPLLAPHVVPVYVEAADRGTEARLLNGLARRCSSVPAGRDLAETLAAVRRGAGLPPGKKLLLVLDQFEQWLHVRPQQEDTELARALRQCDGDRLQCLLLVRDDFWMAVSRFMRELEVGIVEGRNAAAVDLFSTRHARRVLAAFGRALDEALPRGELTREQESFLTQAVEGLAEGGKVSPVRLALFAEMMKGRPWEVKTLKAVGGMEGIGVTFLEETFSAPTAPPEHRHHQRAAQEVLRALLPEAGADIKGHMRSREELLAASGYASRPDDFERLLSILDAELRLITPTDPEGVGAGDGATEGRYYQLAHDYLVPSLREWLTRKQKATWRGRAELRLAERTAEWSSRQERRFVPSLAEYLWLAWGVPRSKRKPAEQALLATAARSHALRWGTALCALVLLGALLQQSLTSVSRKARQERAESLVNVVANAAPQNVPTAIEHLKPMADVCLPIVRERFRGAPEDSSQRLHLAFALASFGEVEEDFLLRRITTLPVSEAGNMMAALSSGTTTLAPKLLQRVEGEQNAELRARFAVMLLHLGDPRGAEQVSALHADPAPRTAFIHSFAAWHGNLDPLPGLLLSSRSPTFQSGVCAALGLLDKSSLAPEERVRLVQACQHLYLNAPDGGTHSAAGWALRQWQEELPRPGGTRSGPAGRDWFVNGRGMTMVLIPAGEFTMGDPEWPGVVPRSVTLRRPFFLCDTEVSIDLYRQFLRDPGPGVRKPQPAWKDRGFPGERAMGSVSWVDALLFCNWLSSREGRKPCYREGGRKADGDKPGGELSWSCDFEADGYRLPTEEEWEYACRAGSKAAFSFGNDAKLLPHYAIFNLNSEEHAWPGGQKLPNGWGLFDMHGNVAEWCWLEHEQLPATSAKAPAPRAGTNARPFRGGDYFNDGLHARSGRPSDKWDARSRFLFVGFRVLCSAE